MLLGHIFRLILKRLFSESPPSFLIASLKYKLQKLEKSFLKCSNSCQVYLNPRVCITILQIGIFICQLVLSLCFACSVTQSCLTLCNPMNYSQPGPTGHGIFQARILEWAAISSSRASPPPRDQTCVSCIFLHSLPLISTTWVEPGLCDAKVDVLPNMSKKGEQTEGWKEREAGINGNCA